LATDQGYTKAQYSLALFYSRWEDVEQDNVIAVKWVKEALKNDPKFTETRKLLNMLQGTGL